MKHQIEYCLARHRTRIRLTCLFMAFFISSCGQNPTRQTVDQFEATKPVSVKYEVQGGDSLVKIARQMTGNAENWPEIAAINGIAEPKAMQVGMVLLIPDYLLPELAEIQTERTTSPEPEVTDAINEIPETPAPKPVFIAVSSAEPINAKAAVVAIEKEPLRPIKRAKKDWIFQASSLPGKLEISAVVHRATANRTFEIERTDEASLAVSSGTDSVAASSSNPGVVVNQTIRVVGTYYPKGIYSQPSYTSNLLMRIAPGTQFDLEQSFGDWLQIRTESGSGYIRSIDAVIIDDAEKEAVLLSNNG